jgi:hypothetical protein
MRSLGGCVVKGARGLSRITPGSALPRDAAGTRGRSRGANWAAAAPASLEEAGAGRGSFLPYRPWLAHSERLGHIATGEFALAPNDARKWPRPWPWPARVSSMAPAGLPLCCLTSQLFREGQEARRTCSKGVGGNPKGPHPRTRRIPLRRNPLPRCLPRTSHRG